MLELSLETMRRVVAEAADGGARPWSLDRWNRLLRWVLKRGDFASFAAVMDAMAELHLKENEETCAIIAGAAVGSRKLVPEAGLRPSLPEVVFLEATSSADDGPLPVFDTLFPDADGEDATAAHEAAGLVRRALELNTEATGAALPPAACLDVPLVPGTRFSEVASLIAKPREQPLSVFQVVGAREFVEPMRARVPNFGALENRRPGEQLASDSDVPLSLNAGDLQIQASALQGGVARYTLVITEAEELGEEPRRRMDKVKLSRAHPKVTQQRGVVLAQALQRAAETTGSGADVRVFLVDARSGQGVSALWRRLWECVLPLGGGLKGASASDAKGADGLEQHLDV
mmetsp:Transcript_95578/g.297556  ORF Transcript_95578/g.297556 Transcript_95578/m.297556 type:complete len:345 (-) Transcript_95578:12-1046(-)